jgi:hypothetical protein
LEYRSLAEKIGSGHAYKHASEFPGIQTKGQFINEIESILNDSTTVTKGLQNGRTAYWSDSRGVIIIRNPLDVDQGTCFKPVQGRYYYDNVVK